MVDMFNLDFPNNKYFKFDHIIENNKVITIESIKVRNLISWPKEQITKTQKEKLAWLFPRALTGPAYLNDYANQTSTLIFRVRAEDATLFRLKFPDT